MCSADLQISEIITKNSLSRKSTSEASCGILSAKSSESGERMTQYDELYSLNQRLITARYKLKKAQARVEELERQIAKIKNNQPKDRWDVT